MQYKNLKFTWLGHDGFRITDGNFTLFFDPFKIKHVMNGHFVFITHSHYDHCSVEDLKKITNDQTHIFITPDCSSKIPDIKGIVHIVESGNKIRAGPLSIEVVRAYNIDKIFHSREQEWIGYIIDFNGIKIYHAGDTDVIPEMKNYSCDIALLPVSGTYVMNAEEAARACEIIKPKLAIPMHYGTIIGSSKDAEEFKQLVENKNISKVEILEAE